MSPLACLLLACACTTLVSLASGNVLTLDVRSLDLLAPTVLPRVAGQPALIQNCTILRIGKKNNVGLRVVKYDDNMSFWTAEDKPLLLPKVPVFGVLKGAKITACNPTGIRPFLIANDGDNISAQLHCSFMEKPKRCPLGLDIHIEEYYQVALLNSTVLKSGRMQ